MKTLKALVVEDSELDEELLLRQLAKADYDVQSIRVQTAADMEKALAESEWDIILSDYAMPGFSGLDALRVLKESGRDIPLIIISGTIGEDVAVEAMRVGVDDYLMKGNLTRLAPAIERELENAASRLAQKRAEEALRRSQENLANAQRIAKLGSWDWDIQNDQLSWSEEIYRIFGFSNSDFEGTFEAFLKIVHPNDRHLVQSAVDTALTRNTSYSLEHRIIRPDGEERTVCETGEATFDDSGKPLRFIGTVQDITERKAAETEMRLMKSAVDSIVEGVVITDPQKPDNPIIYTNTAFKNLTGYTFEEIKKQNCRFLQGTETNPRTIGEIREAIKQKKSFRGEILNYRKNGESFWNELSISPVFDQSGRLTNFVGVQQDISERKQTEEILRASEAKVRKLVDSSIIGITTTRLDGSIVEANDVFLKTVGYSRQELLAGKLRWDEMTPPEIFWQDERAKEQLFKLGYSIPREKEYIRKDGSRVPVMVGGTLLNDSENNIIAFVLDISEQKRVEEEKRLLNIQIEQQHERLNNILANVPGVVWEAWGKPDAATQRIDFVSDYVETLLGYTVEEWVSTPNFWLSIVHSEDKERIAHETAERFHTGEGYTKQFRWIAKDGRIVWVESQATIIRNESGQPIGLRGINIDITERKRLEQERTKLLTALDSEKARLQHIFDNSPSFIVSMRGPEFVFEMANPAYYQLVGQRDLVGIPANEALPEVMTQGLPELLRQVYNTGKPFIGNEVPVKLQPKDGSELELHYVNFVYMPTREADNSISGIVSYGMDVTEQVLSRFKIQESEERYRFLFDKNPLPMWVFELETLAFLSVNDAAIAHYGYSREEFLTMTVKDIRPPEDVPFFLETKAKDAPGIRNEGVRSHIKKDGTIIDVEITTNQFIFNGKKAKLVLANDVTERRKAEASVRFQAHLLNTVEQSVIATDLNGIVTYWNQFAEKLYGWTTAEAVGRDIRELTTPEIKLELANQIMARLSAGKSWAGEFIVQNKAGEKFPAYVSNSPVNDDAGHLFGIVGFSVDITERKRAEQLILESEEKYRSIVETANEGIWLTDLETRATYVNRQMAEMLGYSVEEMLGRQIFDFIFDEDLPDAKQKYEQRKIGKSETGEFRMRRKDGSEIITLFNTTPRKNQAGEIVGFLSMRSDITESKKAERELQKAEAKYRNLVESSPAIVYLAEPHPPFSTIYVSPNISRFGYTTEEWLERPDKWISIIHEDDRKEVLRATENAIARNTKTSLEYRIIGPDGTVIWVHDEGGFVLDEKGNKTGWQGLMVDITNTKELEEQLRQSQKLESVGRLAGGIAHDFNNMLTAINGYSELTLRKLDADSPLRRNIEEIKKAGERSAQLTHQLLAFSRQQVLQPVVLDLNEVIADTTNLLERLIGEDVELVTALNPKTGRVNADPGQLSQIIINLAVNARDAMPHGGKLTIETANVFLKPDDVRQKVGVLPGAYVLLTVCDTGEGINESVQPHIFEPFFTTKETGKGTGLGLATVYGIVKQSGGNIEVESKQGIGTTFKVYLPRVIEQVAVEVEKSLVENTAETETILLVEDEELVRNLSKEILESSGYKVIEAKDGLEALKICKNEDVKFDLLMTDVVMPQMGGRELAEKLTEMMPNVKILFTSGYTDDAVVRHGVIEINTNFLQKPFTFEALTRKVRELLDE